MKKISDSYLYRVADYGKKIFEYLMSAERVDKNADGFTDVVYRNVFSKHFRGIDKFCSVIRSS